jgi:hypothetical protein
VPTRDDRTGKNRVSDLPSTVCPKGKFAGGTTGAHKMCYGPPWSTMVTHYKNTIINRPLCKFTMVRAGWLGSTDCGSHGRGPRFDPLCAHHVFVEFNDLTVQFPCGVPQKSGGTVRHIGTTRLPKMTRPPRPPNCRFRAQASRCCGQTAFRHELANGQREGRPPLPCASRCSLMLKYQRGFAMQPFTLPPMNT